MKKSTTTFLQAQEKSEQWFCRFFFGTSGLEDYFLPPVTIFAFNGGPTGCNGGHSVNYLLSTFYDVNQVPVITLDTRRFVPTFISDRMAVKYWVALKKRSNDCSLAGYVRNIFHNYTIWCIISCNMVAKQNTKIECCPPKPKLSEREPISSQQAKEVMDLFKVLANDTRLRLIHALVRRGELCVTELAIAVGMKPQAVSNQLQRLLDKGVLRSRRNGIQIFYQISDPCVAALLDKGLCLIEDSKERRNP